MKTFFYVLILVFIVILTLTLFPINTDKTNCIKVNGIVENITEGGAKDLVFQLKNDPITYYINRGLENEFEVLQAKKDFIGKHVDIFYAKNWTPLAPFGTTSKHITEIVVNDTVIYSEWK